MDRKAFYDGVRKRDFKLFGTSLSQGQVDKIEAVLTGLENLVVPINQAAYILATAYHESDRFRTAEEYASGRAYEGRADLGNVLQGDGVRFKGRGLVQITGRRNYADWAKRLGVDLVAYPTKAAELRYAVPILIKGMLLGTFTGKKLGDYVSGEKADFRNARRVVNGMDKAALIEGYAKAFIKALTAAKYAPSRIEAPIPASKAPEAPQTRPTGRKIGPVAVLVLLVAAIIGFAGDIIEFFTNLIGF